MKFTDGGIKTIRNVNESSKNAELLTKGSFVDQLSSGVYTFLPLGKMVLDKIVAIIKEEMEAIGGQEVVMPVLHPAENWMTTKRWDELDVLYRFTSYYTKTDQVLGPTHEEVVTPLAKKFINSYKDLPLYFYQIQTKFRDEKRAKSGLLRTREFLMKDLYSFHASEEDLDDYYKKAMGAYKKIYERLGLGDHTYLTFASGGTFSKYSHEYQTVCESGEDLIYLCEKCKVAINKEIIKDQNECPECGSKDLKEVKAIEVGNIFKLGTKYSSAFGLTYRDKNDQEHDVVMGCYGIGPSRIMGTIVERFNDERGIIWPKAVAPFDAHLVDLDGRGEDASEIYDKLTAAGIEVLWDNREETPGVKLADADLIGIPTRIVISAKTGKNIEVKKRTEKEVKLVSLNEFLKGLGENK